MADFFVNCDWGTSRFRLRLVAIDGGAIVAEHDSPLGVGRLAEETPVAARPGRFAAALADGLGAPGTRHAAELRGATVVVSGMASSTIGWLELAYSELPWRVDGSDSVWRELPAPAGAGLGHRTILISGVRAASDVMRGEETEALGLFQLPLAAPLGKRSIVVLPGTHSKHLRILGNAIIDFQTFMTGELFGVLAQHSVLRHSVGPGGGTARRRTTSRRRLSRECGWPASCRWRTALFRVRTRQVLDGMEPAANRDFLSGVLIGGELAYLAGADRDAPIVLAAAASLAAPYEAGIAALGLAARTVVIPPDDVARLSAPGQALLLRQICRK